MRNTSRLMGCIDAQAALKAIGLRIQSTKEAFALQCVKIPG
ncbi:hypothetical protein [Paraburkholderia bannensis]|nr:hypothetical protein [Paraburkholderia bannensis]